MPAIGHVTKQNDAYHGELRTLAFRAPIDILPNTAKNGSKQPDYRVYSKNTDIGAINSLEQLERIRHLAGVGDDEGAERWTADCDLPAKGYWFAPTVFTGVSQAHRIAREEIFGPVLSVLTFRTPDEAVKKANDTEYGLACGVWSEKTSKLFETAHALNSGVEQSTALAISPITRMSFCHTSTFMVAGR